MEGIGLGYQNACQLKAAVMRQLLPGAPYSALPRIFSIVLLSRATIFAISVRFACEDLLNAVASSLCAFAFPISRYPSSRSQKFLSIDAEYGAKSGRLVLRFAISTDRS